MSAEPLADLDAILDNIVKHIGLNQHTLYRIPAGAVSYHPILANRRVWYTGKTRRAVADGGIFSEFRFADDTPPRGHNQTVWLKPWAVSKD